MLAARAGDDDAALRLVLADRLDGVLHEVENGLHELVAIAGDGRQRWIVVLDETDAAAESGLTQPAHVIEQIEGEQEPVVTVGNADPVRDFSDVRDVMEGYVALLERGRTGDPRQR